MPEPTSREQLAQRAEIAEVTSSRSQIEQFLKESVKEVLVALARNPNLQERDFLRLLDRKDLPQEAVSELATHKAIACHYTVRLALVCHPRTPRLISLPLMKFLYPFDLVRVSQTPAVPADVKRVAEETLLKRLKGLPRGEIIALARRGTGRVAAALAVTDDPDLIQAVLGNPRLTEAHLLKVLAREDLPARVVEAISSHERWSYRYHLRLALIRNLHTPFARVLAYLPNLAVNDLRDICLDHRMAEPVRTYILAHCAQRLNKGRESLPSE